MLTRKLLILLVLILRDGRSYDQVKIAGYELSQAAGRPSLPERGVLLGISAGVTPTLSLVSSEQQTAAGFRIAPAAAYELAEAGEDVKRGEVEGEALTSTALRARTVAKADIYGAAALYPAASVEIAEIGHLHDQRYVKLLIHPVQEAMFGSDLTRMSQAAIAAKLDLYTNSGPNLDLLNTFAVLGDPALRIGRGAATPTPTATATQTSSVTPTATHTPTATPTATQTSSVTPTATQTSSVTPTATHTATASATATPTPTIATLTPTSTPTPYRLLLPVILHAYLALPDLIISPTTTNPR